ncbi:uncharacterized protein A4U43_C06F210 [Asparagus officinalis]|uniref:Uncharacterized protein n=1 Tax=Asparagus officinalis TaxID=4686 RepID=A0A5P1EKJ9_ASPOF|nr:uncharacterized protein A4U43_C06F210 [Asparagus officinalis]
MYGVILVHVEARAFCYGEPDIRATVRVRANSSFIPSSKSYSSSFVGSSMATISPRLTFGPRAEANANGIISETKAEAQSPASAAETALSQRCVESVMFKGKKISQQTNGERIEWASSELIKEQDRRKKGERACGTVHD